MRVHDQSAARPFVQPLEPRRLLSFTPTGPDAVVLPTGLNELDADVAVAADGSYAVARVAATRAAGTEPRTASVVFTRYSAAGVQVGAPLTLDTFTYDTSIGADVAAAMDADGDAVVAYAVAGATQRVAFVRVSRAGAAGSPVLLAEDDADEVFWPAVSMDPGGGFFVGWLELAYRQVGEPGEPFDELEASARVRAYDAVGAARGAEFIAASELGGYDPEQEIPPPNAHYLKLDLAATPDGAGAVFAYEVSTGYGYTVEFGRVSTTARVGAVGKIDPDRDQTSPAVAAHADGSFVIGYLDAGTNFTGTEDALAQRFDATGARLGTPIAIATPTGARTIPALSIDDAPDGGFVAAYQLVDREKPANVPRQSIHAVRYAPSGAAEGPVATVAADMSFSDSFVNPLAIGVDGGGSAVVIFEQPDRAMYARRLAADAADVAFNDRGDLYVLGTDAADHIIVERVRENVFVNINGDVHRFAAADVRVLSINGFGGDDDIDNNTNFASTIHGGDGSDTVWGGMHNDRIRGLGGDDVLRGGDGDDQLLGDAGSDSLHGGDGDDDLAGDAGEDTLVGASGDDALRGHRGGDRLFGEAGDDLLDGGDGPDYFEGGAGHDVLTGGGAADALFGLAGDDRFFSADDGEVDTVRGGAGSDTALVDEDDDVLAVETFA